VGKRRAMNRLGESQEKRRVASGPRQKLEASTITASETRSTSGRQTREPDEPETDGPSLIPTV